MLIVIKGLLLLLDSVPLPLHIIQKLLDVIKLALVVQILEIIAI